MSDEPQTRPDDADEATGEVAQDEYDAAAPQEQDAPTERGTRATPQRKRAYGTGRAPEGLIRRPEERL